MNAKKSQCGWRRCESGSYCFYFVFFLLAPSKEKIKFNLEKVEKSVLILFNEKNKLKEYLTDSASCSIKI